MAAVELLDAVAELHLAEGLEVGDDPVALVRAPRHPPHQLGDGLLGHQRLHQKHAVVERHLSSRCRERDRLSSLPLDASPPRARELFSPVTSTPPPRLCATSNRPNISVGLLGFSRPLTARLTLGPGFNAHQNLKFLIFNTISILFFPCNDA
jgi:hypothetical protein